MTPGARLQAVLELLDLIEAEATVPANQLLATFFRQRRFIGSHDRPSITQIVYGVLRTRAHVDHFLLSQGVPLPYPQRLRLLIYLTWKEELSLDQITLWFSGQRYDPAPLTAFETNLLANPFPEESCLPMEVQAEIPLPLMAFFQEAFPENFLPETLALQEEAPVDIRVNTLKSSVLEVQRLLKQEGVLADPTPFSPWALRLKTRRPLSGLSPFQEGLFEIQDEGAQLLSLLTGALPGERVVDFCAGAGGKTLALAALMKNKGHILACDTASWRLKRAQERFRRAGVHNASLHSLEGHWDPWLKRHQGKIDRVLVDVPCSGTGTWRRHPEQRWRLVPEDVSRLAALQQEILRSAARLVRPGGFLIYGTCSLFHAENQAQITLFLQEFSHFSLVPVASLLPFVPWSVPEFLFLTPYRQGTDGFFGVILQHCL